jgi:hypothetical protein
MKVRCSHGAPRAWVKTIRERNTAAVSNDANASRRFAAARAHSEPRDPFQEACLPRFDLSLKFGSLVSVERIVLGPA